MLDSAPATGEQTPAQSTGTSFLAGASTVQVKGEAALPVLGNHSESVPGSVPAITDPPKRPEWMAQLVGDLKGDEQLTKFLTISELGKSYKELEGKLGSALFIPKDPADAEGWKSFFSRLGRPDDPKGYGLRPLAGTTDEDVAEFQKAAHEAGLAGTQAKRLFEWIGQKAEAKAKADAQEAQDAVANATAALRKEWGKKFEENVQAVDRAMKTFEIEGLREKLAEKGLDNDPVLIKFLAKIGQGLGEATFVNGSLAGGAVETGGFDYPGIK